MCHLQKRIHAPRRVQRQDAKVLLQRMLERQRSKSNRMSPMQKKSNNLQKPKQKVLQSAMQGSRLSYSLQGSKQPFLAGRQNRSNADYKDLRSIWGVANGSIQARQLYVHTLWSQGMLSRSGPYQAKSGPPRADVRCLERSHPMQTLPSQDRYMGKKKEIVNI